MAENKASWVTAKPEDIKAKIIELAKQGSSPEKIGLFLRDQQGIPKAKLLGLKISKVLREANLYQDNEKISRLKKVEILKKHIEQHKHDYSAARSHTKNLARINPSRKSK